MLYGVGYTSAELETLAMLRDLHTSALNLTLTGSRFFGTGSSISDWDFFAEVTPETVAELECLGFRCIPNHVYLDSNTDSVYYKDNIHIQLVKNIEAKMIAQTYLLRIGIFKLETNKLKCYRIWEATYEVMGMEAFWKKVE